MKKSNNKSKRESAAIDRKRLLTNDTPFAIKEAYVKLRTNLMFCLTADKSRACKVFGITSSHQSEGKSLTAANIAISYAMLGKSTLLIDCDMRKPRQRALWHAENANGLCDFLASIKPLQLAQLEDIPLSLAFTGTIPPNPSELLSSDRMKQLIEACSRKYDYIILDTPPVGTVADAQIVAGFADGMVLVARSGNTSKDELSDSIDMLKRAGGNFCGVVLNEMNMKAIRYSYHYRYGDKYGYKYSYEAYETK